MRVHRLIRILMKIDQEVKVKAHDMAQALEVSDRTIYRDIDVLCEAGYPITTTTGQNGGIAFVEGYQLNLDQTDDTLKTLITNLYALPEQERLVNALESGMNLKYISLNLGDQKKRSDHRQQKLLIDKKSWWDEASTEIEIQSIMEALFQQKKMNVQYTLRDGTTSERVIAPYGMVLKYTEWYLVAYCYQRNEIRTFHCSRIKLISLLSECYTIPDDFVLKSYWSFSTKAFKESRNKSEYYPVEIKVHKSFESIFQNYDVIGIRNDGDYVIGRIDLHRKDVAENDIRAFLCYGQILFPEEMKLKASEILECSMKWYNYTKRPLI